MNTNSITASSLLLLLFFIGSVNSIFAQTTHSHFLSFAYEGGTITHPGLSVGYAVQLKETPKWQSLASVKTGLYYHKRYQTAFFLLPNLQVQHIGKRGFILGAEISAGIQRTFIPLAYEFLDNGTIKRERYAGFMQFIVAPGIRIGKDLFIKKDIPIQIFINPQLQLRNPLVGRMEKYLLMGIGVNYKL